MNSEPKQFVWWRPPMPQLCRDAERLCKLLAPLDLAGIPVYVETASTLGGGYERIGRHNFGFTSHVLDVQFRDLIGDRWCGRGVAMWINDTATEQNCRERGVLDGFLRKFFTVVVHELGHILNRRSIVGDAPNIPVGEQREQTISTVENYADEPICGPHAALPWKDHEVSWIRTMIHLHYRATLLGFDFDLTATCAGWRYLLSSSSLYRAALGYEPEVLATKSFAEIKDYPMPGDFWSLWLYDVDRQEQSKNEAEADVAADNPLVST